MARLRDFKFNVQLPPRFNHDVDGLGAWKYAKTGHFEKLAPTSEVRPPGDSFVYGQSPLRGGESVPIYYRFVSKA